MNLRSNVVCVLSTHRNTAAQESCISKFMGRQSDVSVGREVFAGEIQKVEMIFKAKIPLVDTREAALPTGKMQTSGKVPDMIWACLDDVF